MIFISYRRADSESVVGRIYLELKKHFPTQDVFLDHDSIPLGKPFLDVIRERLAASKFVLVLVGPQWCSIKDDKTGQRRLDDPNDFVRLEVETALATHGMNVIPLWVMRANTTSEEIMALPSSLQPLFKNHGMKIRPIPDEDGDIYRLVGRLTRQSDTTRYSLLLACKALQEKGLRLTDTNVLEFLDAVGDVVAIVKQDIRGLRTIPGTQQFAEEVNHLLELRKTLRENLDRVSAFVPDINKAISSLLDANSQIIAALSRLDM